MGVSMLQKKVNEHTQAKESVTALEAQRTQLLPELEDAPSPVLLEEKAEKNEDDDEDVDEDDAEEVSIQDDTEEKANESDNDDEDEFEDEDEETDGKGGK